MSEVVTDPVEVSPVCDAIGCPPPAQRSSAVMSDPRADLLALAAQLSRSRSHRLLIEYLRLRRAVR